MVAEAIDYFSNHAMKYRFPWRLYHQPILEGLQRAVHAAPGPEVLNVGSGPFFELSRLERGRARFTACDIDPRAIELARTLHGRALAGSDVLQPGAPLPYTDARFDLVVAMDVIEHLAAPSPWLAELTRVLTPGGHLYLTTPNYGSLSLSLIERTVLEAVARAKGFTRRGLHPTPFDAQRLATLLRSHALDSVEVRPIALGWVLEASGIKRSPRHAQP